MIISPRDFVINNNIIYNSLGSYTVIPVISNRNDNIIVDLPYHIRRLYNSSEIILNNDSNNNIKYYDDTNDSFPSFDSVIDSVATSISEAISNTEADVCNCIENGGIVSCMGPIGWNNNSSRLHWSFNSMYFSSIASTVSDNDFIVDLVPYVRNWATAKPTNWTIERCPLTSYSSCSIPINETLLIRKNLDLPYLNNSGNSSIDDNSYYITEGLISNVFVISYCNDSLRSPVIITPPPTVALAGSMRRIVLLLCRYLNIAVKEECIKVSDYKSWSGMFVTSSLKRIVNVDAVLINGNSVTSKSNYKKAGMLWRFGSKTRKQDTHSAANDNTGRSIDPVINTLMVLLESFYRESDEQLSDFIREKLGYDPFFRIPNPNNITDNTLKNYLTASYIQQ